MADYFSLLSRAVANLPKTSPASTRKAIYDRARRALTNQLRSLKPPLPEGDIAREERALDEAVAKLEAEFEPAMADVLPMAPPTAPAAPPSAPLAAPVAPRSLDIPRVPSAPTIVANRAPAPSHVRPTLSASGPSLDSPLRRPPPLMIPSLSANAPRRELPEAVSPAVRVPDPTPDETDNAPRLFSQADAAEEASAPALGRAEGEPLRPNAPGVRIEKRGSPWVWIAIAVAVGFAGAIAVAAWFMRESPQDLPIKPIAEAPGAAGPGAGDKIVERVGGDVAATPSPAASPSSAPATPTPAPAAAATLKASPSPSPSSSPAPAPVASAAPTTTAAPVNPSTSSTPAPASEGATIPVAARAAMLVAAVADASRPTISLGAVVWSTIPAPPGQPGGMGIKAEVDIPELKMHASMVLRKNFDAGLPASHTIDLRLTFDPGSPIKGVKDIALPLMRRDDPPAADALLGVRVKINDNYFLIGLNRADADVARNVDEIANRGWFDFPMQLSDDRIAKLTFEKAPDGEKALTEALAAWK